MTYKLYIRPHLDYGDVIYHNQRADLMHLVEQTQYKAGLVVSGCWQGSSREKLYKELGWESLTDRRWFHRMTVFYKISNGLTPYLADHIPRKKENSFNLRTKRTIVTPPVRTARFSNSFFPYCINQWHNLDDNIKCLSTLQLFKKHLITYIRPPVNSLFEIQDKIGIKLLTKIRVEFSDLRDHRFAHNFNCSSPVCRCGLEDENTVHYFLCCPLYSRQRIALLDNVSNIVGTDINVLPNEHLMHVLLYGSNVYNKMCNKLIIHETIMYIKKSERFDSLEAFQLE